MEEGRRFARSFFERYTPLVARGLLGALLVRVAEDGAVMAGRVVEVEAYRGNDDPASHAYRGPTRRAAVMFGRAGVAYVYLSYGNHHCINVVTEREGAPGAVLIRALQPVRGMGRMKENRRVDDPLRLTNGPGKLTKAMSIDLRLNGEDLVTSEALYLLAGGGEGRPGVGTSARVGVSVARRRRWRYFIEGNPFVSGARTQRMGRARKRIR